MASYATFLSLVVLALLSVAHGQNREFSITSLDAPIPTKCPKFDDPNLNIHIAHESDCTKYYQCSNGEKVLKQCPSGLHFNPKLQVCDYPVNAGCTPIGGNTSTTSTTPSSTTSTTPLTTTSTTPSTTTSTTPSITTSTTPSTTTSTTPSTTTSTTPSTTTSTTPSTTTSTTPSTTTSTTPSITTSTTPSTTTSTTPSTTTSTTPSTTTSTTPSTTTSTTPSTTTSTTPSTTTSTTPSTTTSTTPSTGYPTTCPKYNTPDRIFLPHECICSKYYVCYKGLQILQECSQNLHFNPSKHVCDDPTNAGCENIIASTVQPPITPPVQPPTVEPTEPSRGTPPTEQPPPITPPTQPPSSQECPPNNEGNAVHLPHESNCSWFYKCNFGKKVLLKCLPGLYFDPKLQVCNWANLVDCKSSSF